MNRLRIRYLADRSGRDFSFAVIEVILASVYFYVDLQDILEAKEKEDVDFHGKC